MNPLQPTQDSEHRTASTPLSARRISPRDRLQDRVGIEIRDSEGRVRERTVP